MTTLSELVGEYGANGFIMNDAGNGSAGPSWVEWDEKIADEYGDTEMFVNPDKNIKKTAQYVIGGYDSDEIYTSEWFNADKDPGATNPFRQQIIF